MTIAPHHATDLASAHETQDHPHLSAVSESTDNGRPSSAPDALTWHQLLTGYAADLRQRGSTPAVLASRIGQARRLGRDHPAGPALVSRADLLRFLSRREWGHFTRRAHLATVRDLFGWAHLAGHLLTNPAGSLPTAQSITDAVTATGAEEPLTLRPMDRATRHAIDSAPEHPARAWARSTGYPHTTTGRLAGDVLEAWGKAGRPLVALAEDDDPTGWATLVDAYTVELNARGLRPSTIALRRRTVLRVAAMLSDHVTQTTRNDLIDFLADPSWAPNTRHNLRAGVVNFFTWAHDTNRLPSNPAARLPSVRIPVGVARPAPETVIRDAINGARADVRLMILLGSLAGLRRAEIANLRTDAFTEDGLRITGKGGNTRLIPLHPSLAEEVELYREATGRTGTVYLFTPRDSEEPYTAGHVGALISKRMPAGWSAHPLRHRFASRSYAGQYNLRAVQELLGHASPAVTARYVAVPDAASRDAVLAVPPIPGIERFRRPTPAHR